MRHTYFFAALLMLSQATALAKDDVEGMTTSVVQTGGGGFPRFDNQLRGAPEGAEKTYRLAARTNTVYGTNGFVPIDSTTYSYSDGRYGVVDQDKPGNDEYVLFDNSYTYIYNSSISAYDNRLYRRQTFDNSDNVTSLTYSSWHTLTSAWKDSARYVYDYITGTSKINTTIFQLYQGGSLWVQHDQSSLTYNGNFVTNVSSLSYDADFQYDGNNNIISIEDKVFDHLTGTLNNNLHKTYTYNSQNEAVTFTLQNWDKTSSSWINTEYWEYTYTNNQLTSALQYSWSGGMWTLYAKHVYAYVNATDKKSETVLTWDANSKTFSNYSYQLWSYNSRGLIETITDYHWNNNTGNWQSISGDQQVRYYYEYYAPTSVASIKSNNALRLYPVPATSSINLDMKWKDAHSFYVTVYNIAGQPVMQLNEQPALSYSKQVDVRTLPVGNYIVRCTNGTESAEGKFIIQR